MSAKKVMSYTRKDGRVIEMVRGGAKRRDSAGIRNTPIGPEFGLHDIVDRAYRRWCLKRGFNP